MTWPSGVGAPGNQGVSTFIQDNVGAVGYVELAFAVHDGIPYAAVRNAYRKFVYPSIASVTAAAEGVTLPPDFRKVITNTRTPGGYPLTGFTFILVYPDAKPALKGFLTWALTDGQKDTAELLYAPLPPSIQKRALAVVAALR